MTVYIYVLCDPRTGEIRYVGKTINIQERFKGHCGCKVGTYKSNWIVGLKMLGLKPMVEVLETIKNSDDTDWQHVERFWIAYLRFLGFALTNLDDGGMAGKRPCVETRRKMSASRKGRPISAHQRAVLLAASTGRKMKPEWIAARKASIGDFRHSEGTKLKMRLAHMGKQHTPESKAKIGAAHKGRTHSKESIEKMRLSQSGKKASEATLIKLRLASTGRKHSEETKAKLVAIHRGAKRSETARKNISQGTQAAVNRDRAAKGLPPATQESKRLLFNACRKDWRAKRKELGLPYC